MDAHQQAAASEVGYADVRRQLEKAGAAAREQPIRDVVRVPTVVHLVSGETTPHVDDATVQRQIERLSDDFRARNEDATRVPAPFEALVADTLVEFHLATRDPLGNPTSGITRTSTSIRRFPRTSPVDPRRRTAAIDRELKTAETGAVAWPREQYLNVWVCDMGRDPLGYAAFPGAAAWRDGVVIDVRCFGIGGAALPPYDLGRTLTHEVGHWLDLLHIWGDDNGACSRSDNVADTPNQAGPNGGVPAFPSISCNNHPHGDLFVNFMDYTDDIGMVMFTEGQVARMHAALRRARASLLLSDGLEAPAADEERSGNRIIAMTAGSPGSAPTVVFDGVGWVRP